MKIYALLLLLSAPLATIASEFRDWTDTRGNVIDARLLKDNGNGTIQILRRDGWRGDVPLDLLSEADKDYVKVAALALSLESADPVLSKKYEIARLRRENVPGFISTKAGWELKIECIKAELRFHGNSPVENPYMRAYIYDKDGKEIERFQTPPRRQLENQEYVAKPERVHPGEKLEVYFPITAAMKQLGWRTALVVFGDSEEVAAVSTPSKNLIELAFDEKKIVFPDWDPAVAEKLSSPASQPGTGESVNLLPELKSIKRESPPGNTRVDGAWKSNHECITTEVRVRGSLPENVSVSAYFFDASKRRIATQERPAMTNLGGGFYSALPKIASTSKWYPVYFPIDAELKKSSWNWAVVVLQADGKVAANVFGPRGVAATDFDFPGRESLIAAE